MAAEYRGFLVGALLVLALYALLTSWPALHALLNPAAPPPLASPPPAGSRPAAPAALPAPQPAPAAMPASSVASRSAAAQSSPASILAQALTAAQQASAADSDKAPVQVRWQVTVHNVVLSERPGGPGVTPRSISHASLTICGGSSLQVLKQQGDWAKVRSRSLSEGWVSLKDLTLLD